MAHLNPLQRALCEERSVDLLRQALDAWRSFEREQGSLECVAQDEALKMYRSYVPLGNRRYPTPNQQEHAMEELTLLATHVLKASLQDVLDTFAMDDTESFSVAQSLLSSSFVAGRILDMQDPSTFPSPMLRFSGFKWYELDASNDGTYARNASTPCCFLIHERTGTMRDTPTQTQLGYCIQHHVADDHYDRYLPPWMRPPDAYAVCYLFRELGVKDERHVECFVMAHGSLTSQCSPRQAIRPKQLDCDDHFRLPQEFDNPLYSLLVDRIAILQRVLEVTSAKRISNFMSGLTTRTNEPSAACGRCYSRKTVLDAHRVCTACQRSVCRKCRARKWMFLRRAPQSPPRTQIVCTKCMQRAGVPMESMKDSPSVSEELHPNEIPINKLDLEPAARCRGRSVSELANQNHQELRRYRSSPAITQQLRATWAASSPNHSSGELKRQAAAPCQSEEYSKPSNHSNRCLSRIQQDVESNDFIQQEFMRHCRRKGVSHEPPRYLTHSNSFPSNQPVIVTSMSRSKHQRSVTGSTPRATTRDDRAAFHNDLYAI